MGIIRTKNIMIYAYIRVSTDKQTVKNQRYEISNFAKNKNLFIEKWIEEKVSGTKKIQDRKLGCLLKKMKKHDTLLVSEISRLGRNLMQIMSILNFCMENSIKIISIKENYELGDNINSKVLAFAFGLSAEIERNLISQRTKEALARKRAEGISLGRPKGSRSAILKLDNKKDTLQVLLHSGLTKTAICKKLCVCRVTLNKFITKSFIL